MERAFSLLATILQWKRQIKETRRNSETITLSKHSQTANDTTAAEQINTTSQQTFHPFTRLPFELRVMIWDYLATKTEARTVPIRYHRRTQWYTSRARSPVILHINAESRAHGKRIYKELKLRSGKAVTGAYINLSIDKLYICTDSAWLAKPKFERGLIRARDAYLKKDVEIIWDDLLRARSSEMPDLTKRLVTCAEIYWILLWHFILMRSALAPGIETWDIVSEEGQGSFVNDELNEDPKLGGWCREVAQILKNLKSTVEKLNTTDTIDGRTVTLDFKVTYWHWSRTK